MNISNLKIAKDSFAVSKTVGDHQLVFTIGKSSVVGSYWRSGTNIFQITTSTGYNTDGSFTFENVSQEDAAKASEALFSTKTADFTPPEEESSDDGEESSEEEDAEDADEFTHSEEETDQEPSEAEEIEESDDYSIVDQLINNELDNEEVIEDNSEEGMSDDQVVEEDDSDVLSDQDNIDDVGDSDDAQGELPGRLF